jgi:hypothetical protein
MSVSKADALKDKTEHVYGSKTLIIMFKRELLRLSIDEREGK